VLYNASTEERGGAPASVLFLCFLSGRGKGEGKGALAATGSVERGRRGPETSALVSGLEEREERLLLPRRATHHEGREKARVLSLLARSLGHERGRKGESDFAQLGGGRKLYFSLLSRISLAGKRREEVDFFSENSCLSFLYVRGSTTTIISRRSPARKKKSSFLRNPLPIRKKRRGGGGCSPLSGYAEREVKLSWRGKEEGTSTLEKANLYALAFSAGGGGGGGLKTALLSSPKGMCIFTPRGR